MSLFSLSKCLSVVALAYIMYCTTTFYNMFYPQKCNEKESCVYSFFNENSRFTLKFYGYQTNQPKNKHLIADFRDLKLNKAQKKVISVRTPEFLLRNQSSYSIQCELEPVLQFEPHPTRDFVHHLTAESSIQLTKMTKPLPTTYKLLGDKNNKNKQKHDDDDNINDIKNTDNNNGGISAEHPEPHWRSDVFLHIVSETLDFPTSKIPPEFQQLLQVRQIPEKYPLPDRRSISNMNWESLFYLPIIHLNPVMFSEKHLVRIFNASSASSASSSGRHTSASPTLNLTVHIEPISVGLLRLWRMLEVSTDQMQRQFGFHEREVENVREIFAGTNFVLLILTFAVAVFHLLFDFLAFKNDISFWRKASSTTGLSTRVVIWRCFSYSIICLNLREKRTSLLVLVPMCISCAIEFWKLTRVFHVRIGLFSLKFGSRSADERDTDNLDSQGMRYLAVVMLPIALAGAAYSLLYMPHRSWYSWSIETLANGVYLFGFLFMTPQLFINYKLKSVAHLPWKALTYKAFNTFIDDFFAFIITMPTSHRLACFRDDIVFVIYVYQRWLYPVDKSRVNEFGSSLETIEEGEENNKKQVTETAGDSEKQKSK